MKDELVYLDTYLLQQDMRIRMPKLILPNLGAEKGVTMFDVFLDKKHQSLVLKMKIDTDLSFQEESK